MTDSTLAAFDALADTLSLSAVVADSQGRTGVMDPEIKPAFAGPKIIGRAVTAKLSGGDLQDPLGLLDIIGPGSVAVVDAGGDRETAVFGGLMGSLFQLGGARGVVIDGACRDTDENRLIGFPVASRSVTVRGTHTMFSGRKDDVLYQVPVSCGGVIVHPGDIVVADELGVVVVPQADADSVVALAKEQAEREEATRARIREGASFEQLLIEFGRI